MADLTAFLRWLVEYAFSGGLWHFVGVYLLAVVLARITTLFRIDINRKTKRVVKGETKPDPEAA